MPESLFKKSCRFQSLKTETLAQVFSCEFCEVSKNTFFTEHPWSTASVIMRRQNTSLQSAFLIKFYEHEENPTVSQIWEKDVQYFLCLLVSILKPER